MRGEKDLFKLDNMLKSLNYADLGGGVAPRILLAAALLGSSPVCAQELAPVFLENNGLYSLTPVDKQGENTITKFEYNDALGEFVPVYYRVDLNKTDLGHPDVADSVNYYKYTETDGVLGLTNGAADDYDISYSVDSSRIPDSGISNDGNYGDINNDFIGPQYGIKNEGNIGDITGDFIGTSYGIKNEGSIGDIKGDFIGNTSTTLISNNSITSTSIINSIEGNFIGNSKVIINGGGASIGEIKGNFIANTNGVIDQYEVYQSSLPAINSISGNFIGNSITKANDIASGAAISNRSLIGKSLNLNELLYKDTDYSYTKNTFKNADTGESVSFYFASDKTGKRLTLEKFQDAINAGNKIIREDITETLNDEKWTAMKEQIASGAMEGVVTTEPIDIPEENLITTDSLLSKAPIHDSLFIGNHVKSDTTEALGGAIYNSGQIGNSISGQDNISEELKEVFVDIDFNKLSDSTNPSITNSSFYNNYAESETGEAKGGAIYSTTDLTIAADNGESVFSGNKVINNGVEESNAIYIGQYKTSQYDGDLKRSVYTVHDPTLTLNATNGGLIYFDDKIDGSAGTTGRYYEERQADGTYEQIWLEKTENNRYNVELEGDGTGKIVFNNDVENADIFLNDGAITYLGRESVWDTSNLTFNGGSLSLLNNTVGTANFDSLSIAADTDVTVDVDLANSAMDRITADSYGEMNGNLNVVGMNLLSDSAEEQTEILFADTNLKDHVTYGGNAEIPDDFQTTAYTPIHQYDVSYDNKEDGGYFIFQGSGISSGKPSDNFNPAVLSTTVANQAAGQSALNEVFKYSYEHVDSFTKLPSFERMAKINANKYAMSTDFNENMPMFAEQLYNKGVWFKPFTTFENIDLKNGPDVDAITYGTLVGFDTDFHEHRNGWHSVFSGFAGYVGSSLNYSGVDSTMNGGILGFTETFYKGNFWTAISATAGASVGESHNMYGKEDYTSLLAGVSSKTGYNFEFKNGKFIVQPIMYLGYTFVNTFDYKNSAGVNIDSDPLHTIQLNPSVRFIANLKNGWQPYASVGMVWNLMNESKATANNVRLPEMSVKPYVEYGVGVQRNWADKYTGYLQAMVRNGGRTGVSLTGGFRFMLGDETKVTPETPKKDIKSL